MSGGVLPCPLCGTAGEVLPTDIDEQAEADVIDPDDPPPAPEPVTCPLCDGETVVPAGVGFEDLTDGGEDGNVLDGGAAAATREMFEWIAAVEGGDVL